MESSVKERLMQFMSTKGLSQKRFEQAAGLSNGYINSLRHSPSAAKLQSILCAYPELNRDWLLTGNGEMLISDSENSEIGDNTTLLLPISARGGRLVDFSLAAQSHECERVISPIKGIDFAMTVTGDSMAPEYPNGSRVFIKRINERAFIDWGRVYVLDTCNGSVIKKIMPGSTPECVRCVSLNKEYPDFEVQFGDMYGMYRVLLLLTEK